MRQRHAYYFFNDKMLTNLSFNVIVKFINMNDNKRDFFDYVAFIGACVCFSPMLYFIWLALENSSQLRDAIIILVSALVVLALEHKIRPHRPILRKQSFVFLAISYVCFFFGNYIFRQNLDFVAQFIPIWSVYLAFMFAMFAGCSFFLASIGILFFDSKRYVYAISGGFFSFSILSIFFQFADLPLRVWAGRVAGYLLAFVGENVHLLMYKGEIAQIALRVNGQSYLVATECNGFGIISSCLVVSVAIAFFRRNIDVLKRMSLIFIGAFIGFMANILRIVSIISISLLVGNKHYYIYHEALGYLFFISAIILVWFFALKLFLPQKNTERK